VFETFLDDSSLFHRLLLIFAVIVQANSSKYAFVN